MQMINTLNKTKKELLKCNKQLVSDCLIDYPFLLKPWGLGQSPIGLEIQ